MNFFDVLICIGLVLLVVFLMRNEIVYRADKKAIDYIFDQDNWEILRTIHLNKTEENYFRRILQFNKWTFEQFYPGLINV